MRGIVAGCVLGLTGLTGAALAQGAPDMVKPEREPFRQIAIRGFAGEPNQWPAPPAEMIRRAAAKDDPASWLKETDAPIAAWLKTETIENVTLELAVGTSGRVTECKSAPRSWERTPPWADQLCALLIRRAAFIPALREDGQPMADRFIFTASFQFSRNMARGSGPLVVSYGLSPAPPPPPPPGDTNPRLMSWPPSGYWIRSVAREPAFKLPVERPTGAALAGPAIGVVIADPKSGDPECRVVLTSGDAKLDQKACDFARKKLKPQWADTVRFPVRRWPLLLSPEGKDFRAITADENAIRRLRVEPGELARLNALWQPSAAGARVVRMAGPLGPDGRPTRCRVFESSGSDAADVAACRLFRSEAKFALAQDAFGQPGKLTGWINLQLTPP